MAIKFSKNTKPIFKSPRLKFRRGMFLSFLKKTQRRKKSAKQDWESRPSKEEQTLHFFFKGLKALWNLAGHEKKHILFSVFVLAIVSGLRLLFPYLLKLIFDEVPEAIETGKIGNYILILAGAAIAANIVGLWIHHFVGEILFLKSLIRLENFWPVQAQEKLLSLSLGYHERENTGQKISKINKGCDKLVDVLVNLFWGLLPIFFYLVINIIIILFMDWKLGVLFLIPFIPAIIINLKIYKRFIPEWIRWEEQKEYSVGLFCQSIVNVRTVQNFVQEKREKANLSNVRQEMEVLDIGITKKLQRYFFAMGVILYTFFVSTVLFGVYLVFRGESTLGTVAYIMATGTASIQGIFNLVHIYTRVMRNLVAVVRMKELFDEEVEIKSSEDAVIPKKFVGDFEFRDVSFVYPRKDEDRMPVLKNLNLSVHPDQMIALVGRSGEGKTTIVRLLSRMYDITSGDITLDGRNIKKIDLFWYRSLFAIVQQDIDIFDASFLDNIKYANPAISNEQALEAARAAHLSDIIENKKRFPKGIHTQVGERGAKLSGGERQRVGIARAYLALLSGARVLILDEATSSLDSESERAIQEMLTKLRHETSISIVAIAHRLSTIQKADVIYVIKEGEITEKGSHKELMKQGGTYARLVELQRLGD